jgi:hypothetical protein
MTSKRSDDEFSPEEAKERMKAALLGARLAGHKPMEDLIKKKPKVKKVKPKKKPNK